MEILTQKITESMQPDHIRQSSRNRLQSTNPKRETGNPVFERTYNQRMKLAAKTMRRRVNGIGEASEKLKDSANSILAEVHKHKVEDMDHAGLSAYQWKWQPSRTEAAEFVGAARYQGQSMEKERRPLDVQMLPIELRNPIS